MPDNTPPPQIAMTHRYLLVSDLDDTLLGDAAALERFHQFHGQIRERLTLVYASGRFARSVKESIEATQLPQPAAIIGGVGSEIRLYPDLEPVEEWTARISRKWDARLVRQALLHEPGLQLQPEEFQSDHKISFYLHDAPGTRLEELAEKLRRTGVEADYVYSSRRDLDFLPAGVDKGAAAAVLAALWNYGPNQVFVAGNSGNDASLFQHGFLGIVVANAHEELKALRGSRVFLSERERADGVTDGIRHWIGSRGSPAATSPPESAPTDEEALEFGYDKAMALLEACATPEGFLATPTDKANYRRVWARDGCIMGVAALLSGDHGLIECCRRTLLTLARHQGSHGEIPSNVDPKTVRVSFGGTTGRVDADLWFIIACGAYWRTTRDERFLHDVLVTMEKVRFLLGAWEFNDRGLLYVPPAGDWADEYVHHGYVLYDQLLYLQALRELASIHHDLHETEDHFLREKISRLTHLLRANYWFIDGDELPADVYHEVLYRKGRQAASCRGGGDQYWMPFFAPTGYGYRFDAFANVLASLLGVADETQNHAVDRYLDGIVPAKVKLLPAFHPVITPTDMDWSELQMTFSYTFRNAPHEYQNGGLWPVVTGFYVASLAVRGQSKRGAVFLNGIHHANGLNTEDGSWSFPEFLHGQTLVPGGNDLMGWSAAAAVIGTQYLAGKRIFD